MDELNKAWEELNKAEKRIPVDKGKIITSIHSKSTGIMEKINNSLKKKLWFVVGGTLFMAAAMFLAPNLITILILTFICLVYITFGLLLNRERKIIKNDVDLQENMLSTLKNVHFKVRKVLMYEERIGVFIYPFAAIAGFIIGGSLVPDGNLFSETSDYYILGGVLLILTLVGYYLSKYLNKIAFGPYLDQLKTNITELENKDAM